MSIATLKKKTKSTVLSNISSYGSFTLAGTTNRRKPIWCAMHSSNLGVPIKSVKSAGVYNTVGHCGKCQTNIAKPPPEVSYDDYYKTLECCEPLANMNEAVWEKYEEDRLNGLPVQVPGCKKTKKCDAYTRPFISAFNNADYIEWKSRRVLRAGNTDCSLCLVIKK